MSSVQNDNLIRTYSTCTSGHKIYIVMPMMNSGSLNHVLSYKFPQGIKDVSIIATIMRDCLEGLKCLNKNNLYRWFESKLHKLRKDLLCLIIKKIFPLKVQYF